MSVLRVGLTGNIAAGKSTVAGWLAELGCQRIDLDALAHECLRPEAPTYKEVVAAFGEEVLDADGLIDRKRLGQLVFADPDARARLEAILHPAIRHREAREIERFARRVDRGIAVTEAALLFETKGAARYHRMVVVTAPDEVRLARLVAAGLAPDQARARMSAQMDQHDKAERADYVVDNSGSLETAQASTRRLHTYLLRDLDCLVSGKDLPEPAAG